MEPDLFRDPFRADARPGRRPTPAPAARLARARAALAAAAAAPVAMADERTLPVLDPLAAVLPGGGLVRGRTAMCRGEAAASLALALIADATRHGSWAMSIGLPELGLAAAAEMGVALERMVLVGAPPGDQWAVVLAAALDGADLVLVPADAPLAASDARRVQSRLRTRGGVLVLVDTHSTSTMPGATVLTPELVLSTAESAWEGLGRGDGRLCRRRVVFEVGGRRVDGRPRRSAVYLPDADGSLAAAAPAPVASVPAAPHERVMSASWAEVG